MTKSMEVLFREQLTSARTEEEQRIVFEIIDWANKRGLGDYPSTEGEYYSYLVKTKRPIFRIWAKNGDGAGDIEIYFINHNGSFLFEEESSRQQFLDMLLCIPTIETFGKPLTICNRRNIKFTSFSDKQCLGMFLNIIQWAVSHLNKSLIQDNE